jgi:predicted phosphohydrolase
MKIAWLTDIHLEFPDADGLERFYQKLGKASADAVLVSGDIGQAPTVMEFLRELQCAASCPIYFVFGNHDYYHGSIASVRSQSFRAYSTGSIRWLSAAEPIALSKNTCCIGHDGWGDGRNGDFSGSTVRLNDFELIAELAGLPKNRRQQQLMTLGDEAAAHIRKVLPAALSHFQHIFLVTHVPPFPESAWWMGKPSAADWLPFFSCKALGDVLLEFMPRFPGRRMTVLCGHTHGKGTAHVLPNLTVLTGDGRYGHPIIQKMFDCI